MASQRRYSAGASAILGSALGQRVSGNVSKIKCLFFTFVDISMEGIVLGQLGDKCLKLLAFFLPITRGSRNEGIEANLVHFQHYNPDIPIGILGENMFVRHSFTSFLHFPLSANVSE